MGQLRAQGLVGEDTLRLIALSGFLVMVGDISCRCGTVLSVEKYLKVVTPEADPEDVLRDHDIVVQTFMYSYNASVRGHGTIFRYDNNHPRRGHPDWHHVHYCDWRTGDDVGDVRWVGEERWPLLSEAIRELDAWFHDHCTELPTPDEYGEAVIREPRTLWHDT